MKHDPAIIGTGHYVPDNSVRSEDLEQKWDKPDGWIESRTGIRERRMAGDDETTGTMAIEAGQNALRDAGISPDDVGITLLATSTPDKPLPPTAPSVQDALGVTGGAIDLAGSCVGCLDALVTGSQFVRSGTHEYVLVIASNHLTYRVNWSDPNTASLFGDGAGAMVLGRSPSTEERPGANSLELLRAKLGSDGSVDSLDVPAGGSNEPFTPEAWEKDRHLMRMTDGQDVFKLAVQKQVDTARALVDEAGMEVGDLDWLLPHQANQKIMEAVVRQLGIPEDRLLSNIDRYGNTSAASIPIMLNEAVQTDTFSPGDRLLMVAFGCGIRFGGALLRCR
jgi:3-oxoacyl-[acyl-carrier-protein] synthase-3